MTNNDQRQASPRPSFNSDIECRYCHKKGHIERNCFKKKRESENNIGGTAMMMIDTEEMTYLSKTGKSDFNENTWLADTGASCHFTNDDTGLINVQRINERVKIGNGEYMTATKKGTLVGYVVQKNGRKTKIQLEVKYIPELYVNLFSIGRSLHLGWELGNKGTMINLRKGAFKVDFDRVAKTYNGYISGFEIQ